MRNEKDISTKQGNRIKRTSCWFNGTTFAPEQIETIKKYLIEYPFWNYIMHDPDPECDHLHIHFLLNTRGQVSIKSVADTRLCDYGVVQDTRTEKTYARYMLHSGWEEKRSISLLTTSVI